MPCLPSEHDGDPRSSGGFWYAPPLAGVLLEIRLSIAVCQNSPFLGLPSRQEPA